MTPKQLERLSPVFHKGERFLDGTVIDWQTVDFETMLTVKRLREILGAPLRLIRGAHPDPAGRNPFRATAIDACVPTLPLGQVAMGMFRLQQASYGLYSGNSFHLDSRLFTLAPARWLAIRPNEKHHLDRLDLLDLITKQTDGWLYLSWSHKRSHEALQLVLQLAAAHTGTARATNV